MRTRGAIIAQSPGQFEVVDLELEEPREHELLVRMVAAGLCHSDDHLASAESPSALLPICIGHEGAGIVERVGAGAGSFAEGDHVVFSFLPSCGRCRWCATGMQNLCDEGARTIIGTRADGSCRMRLADGTLVRQFGGLGTFSEHTVVDIHSTIKLDKSLPLDRMCLLGCGVGTGWGSAVYSAGVRPGDTVVVMGIGGVGINAVQGATHAGADHVLAVDPVPFKREMALKFGATDAFADMAEATEVARGLTNGQGADSAIVTVGVTTGEHVAQAFSAIRKAGVVVVTGMGPPTTGLPISLTELTLYQKRIQGSLFGASNPTADIPRQIQMYRDGTLNLDDLVTATYSLDQVEQARADMHAGKNLRGVILFGS